MKKALFTLVTIIAIAMAVAPVAQAQLLPDIANQTTQTSFLAATIVDSTGATSDTVDLRGCVGKIMFLVSHTKVQGTNPTLSVHLETSSDNSTFTTVADSMTQQTTTNGVTVFSTRVRSLSRYNRLIVNVGGTATAKYYVSAVGVYQKQYQ